jgi:hypothetical protein
MHWQAKAVSASSPFGVISSTRTLSPISLAQASALALSLVVSRVRQCGFSNTLTTKVVTGFSGISFPR